MKTQIWITISTYLLVSIVKKELRLDLPLYTILQILSLSLFEKLPILQALTDVDYNNLYPDYSNQLSFYLANKLCLTYIEFHIMIGFMVNTATVLTGSGIGLFFGSKLKEKYKNMVLTALGLVTILIGVKMAIKTENILIIVGSMIIGGLIGQWVQIEEKLARLGEKLKTRAGASGRNFVLGFVTASLLFCVGPMTIIGSFEDGLYNKGELIFIKSLMDCFAAMALAAALGSGVIFSALVVFIYQGALTLLARYFQPLLNEMVINEMSAAGGVMMLGIAINLLNLKHIKVGNLLPALPLAAIITWIAK